MCGPNFKFYSYSSNTLTSHTDEMHRARNFYRDYSGYHEAETVSLVFRNDSFHEYLCNIPGDNTSSIFPPPDPGLESSAITMLKPVRRPNRTPCVLVLPDPMPVTDDETAIGAQPAGNSRIHRAPWRSTGTEVRPSRVFLLLLAASCVLAFP